MNKEELIILKYINEYKSISVDKIHQHFHKVRFLRKVFLRNRSPERYSDTSISGCLFRLEVNYDYIRIHDGNARITDKGEIDAYSYIIERNEIWKNRIIGFVTGIATSVIATIIVAAIKVLLIS